MRIFASLCLVGLVGCGPSASQPPHDPTWDPAGAAALGGPTSAQPVSYRRETIVLGSGESTAYDPQSSELARGPQGAPSNVIIVNQQQTVNTGGGYGYYGYGVPYGSYRYGYGTPVTDVNVRTTPTTSQQTLPGANWPTPQSYGPRMLGDRSR